MKSPNDTINLLEYVHLRTFHQLQIIRDVFTND